MIYEERLIHIYAELKSICTRHIVGLTATFVCIIQQSTLLSTLPTSLIILIVLLPLHEEF